jgi:DNA primase
LHTDHKPSFLVDPQKSLFYCYGCGRGGDVIRFVELYHQVRFPQALTLLREWCRSIRSSAPAHRFLPGSKGGLYLWEQVRRCEEVILVEGRFDYAVVWQADFHNVTCALGNHLNARQFQQLCDGPRTVYLAFDADVNGSGLRAAHHLSRRLWAQGIEARRVQLPEKHDPNSFFVQGGNRSQFQALLEAAQP